MIQWIIQLFKIFICKEFFQNSTDFQYFFHVRLSVKMIVIHGAFILKTIRFFVVCKMICAVHVIFFTFGVRRILTVLSRWFCRRNVILLQTVCICSARSVSRNCILVFVCNLFNCIINKNVYVFIFKTRIDVVFKIDSHCFQTFILRYQQFFVRFIFQFVCQFVSICWRICHRRFYNVWIYLFNFWKKMFFIWM